MELNKNFNKHNVRRLQAMRMQQSRIFIYRDERRQTSLPGKEHPTFHQYHTIMTHPSDLANKY